MSAVVCQTCDAPWWLVLGLTLQGYAALLIVTGIVAELRADNPLAPSDYPPPIGDAPTVSRRAPKRVDVDALGAWAWAGIILAAGLVVLSALSIATAIARLT